MAQSGSQLGKTRKSLVPDYDFRRRGFCHGENAGFCIVPVQKLQILDTSIMGYNLDCLCWTLHAAPVSPVGCLTSPQLEVWYNYCTLIAYSSSPVIFFLLSSVALILATYWYIGYLPSCMFASPYQSLYLSVSLTCQCFNLKPFPQCTFFLL